MRTTTRQFDFVNRLTQIASVNNQPSTINQSTYAYDPANQRTSRTEADNSFWLYSYDLLGQATAAKTNCPPRYDSYVDWPDRRRKSTG